MGLVDCGNDFSDTLQENWSEKLIHWAVYREGFVSVVFHKLVTENGVNSNISSSLREKSMDLVLTILCMSHIIEQVQIKISSRDQF